MRRLLATVAILSLLPLAVLAAEKDKTPKLYKWVDENGEVHFGDSIPARYAELQREVVNEHGITVGVMAAKKTEEELAEERRQEELREARELQRRMDMALLATYGTVEEIELHRDRRRELLEAQALVTELYLNNLKDRLEKLEAEASRYRPYSTDPDAPMIEPDLAADIAKTRDTIDRHQANLDKYYEDEQQIVARFDSDIDRFKQLKGLN